MHFQVKRVHNSWALSLTLHATHFSHHPKLTLIFSRSNIMTILSLLVNIILTK